MYSAKAFGRIHVRMHVDVLLVIFHPVRNTVPVFLSFSLLLFRINNCNKFVTAGFLELCFPSYLLFISIFFISFDIQAPFFFFISNKRQFNTAIVII